MPSALGIQAHALVTASNGYGSPDTCMTASVLPCVSLRSTEQRRDQSIWDFLCSRLSSLAPRGVQTMPTHAASAA